MKKISTTFLMLLLSNSLYAGVNGLTHHSRANCINNESISWDLTTSHYLYTVGAHIRNNKFEHWVQTDPVKTWRSAAIHWGEGSQGKWVVEGTYYVRPSEEDPIYYRVKFERVDDCSIYDGWWDHEKKEIQYD